MCRTCDYYQRLRQFPLLRNYGGVAVDELLSMDFENMNERFGMMPKKTQTLVIKGSNLAKEETSIASPMHHEVRPRLDIYTLFSDTTVF